VTAQRRGTRGDIKVGSVWVSRDPRDNGRTITVTSEPSRFGNDFVNAKSTARRTSLRVFTLLDRYDLVEDQP
jgi:hypothetical protein